MQAFLVIVSLDNYLQHDNQFSVRVHQLQVEIIQEQSGKWGDAQLTDLPFEPTKLELNFAESAFLLSGPKGVLVGEFPGKIMNMINHKEQPLEQPSTDVDIICQDVFSGKSPLEVVQAEFNMLNKNNLFVLGKGETGTVLQLVNLHE